MKKTTKKQTKSEWFRDKHGSLPPAMTKKELEEFSQDKSFGSERHEQYYSDVLDFYRTAGPETLAKLRRDEKHEEKTLRDSLGLK